MNYKSNKCVCSYYYCNVVVPSWNLLEYKMSVIIIADKGMGHVI